MARCVVVPVSTDLWQLMITSGYEGHIKCVEGLPEGAELVNSFYNGNPPTAYLVFHHPSFVDIPIGGQFPTIVPSFEQVEWQPV